MIVSDIPAYFDSSVLLSVLLQQPRAGQGAALWQRHRRRVSSVLMEAESRTVLRRAARAGVLTSSLREAEQDLDSALRQIAMHAVDRAVLDALARLPELGACRTLDALHLATAATLRDHIGHHLLIVTFDLEMAEVARNLGFAVAGCDVAAL